MRSPLKRAATWVVARLADETVFAGVVTAMFLAIGIVGVLHHEMWRDEMHSWLVARDSPDLWAIFQVTRYEAHFPLWRVLLWPITRCTHDPVAMQFLNLLVATGTVWITIRFSPFRRWEKVLFGFGYFTLYEYCIIAQDYTLVVLQVFAFCALYQRRTRSYVGLSVVLFLMANTLPYGLVIALVCAALLVFDWDFNGANRRLRIACPDSKVGVSRRNLRVSAVIVFVGIACAGLQLACMKKSPSTTWNPSLSIAVLSQSVANIWRAYVPFPKGFLQWKNLVWGTNAVVDTISQGQGIAVGVSVVLFVISAGLLLRRPAALFLYVLGTISLLWVQFTVSIGAPRHTGFLFLLFIASLWVWHESADWELTTGPWRRLGDWVGSWRRPFVIGLLVIQMAAGVDMFFADYFRSFSSSKRAAQYIREHGLSGLMIVGSDEIRVAPLSGYLDRQIYYLESSRLGSYVDYGAPVKKVPFQQIIMRAWEVAQQTPQPVVLVLGEPLFFGGRTAGTTRVVTGRILSNGDLKPLSEPATPPTATIRLLLLLPAFVDEHYAIYVVQRD